jgi:hypothetical protein
MKETDLLVDLGVDGRISKLLLKKLDMRMSTGYIWLR